MIVCQNCGYQNEDDDTFCGGCPAYLPHSGVHVDDDGAEEPVEVEAVAAEPTGIISRVKGMVGMDEARDEPGDLLVDEAAEREARDAAERAQREADAAAAEAERAANDAAQRREAERKAREEAAERARLEQQAREEAEAAAKAQAEAERKAREEAEAKAQAEAAERERQAAQERAEAERRAQAAREAEAKAKAEIEARERAEAEAAAAVEAEERARKEAEAQALRDAEERTKAEAAERARAEAEAAEREAAAAAEREAAERKAAEEAARRAAEEEEAQRKAEEEAKQRAAEEEKARVEAERRAEEERKAAEQAEREAAEAAERARRAAAMVAKPPPAPPKRPSRRSAPVAAAAAGAAASTATAGAPTGQAGAATGAGPTAMKPTEQRPTAPPPRPPTKKTPPSRKPEPGDQICGKCGEPNRPERKFCRRCANTLADAVVVKRPFWQRIIPRRKPKSVAAGERPGRSAKGTRKAPLGRRIAKFGRMSVRWIIAAILILGILGSLGLAGPWSDRIKGTLDGAYSSVMNRIRPSYEPANPVEAVASAQVRGAAARRVIDGFDNTHWAAGVPVTDRPTLELTWAEPVDIAQVGFLAGGSGDDFRVLARPREVRLIFSDGSRSDITLKDVADFQTFKVGATQARNVRLQVRSVYPAPDSDAVAITELEFFTRR